MGNLTAYRGDNVLLNLLFTDENGDVVDITDWTIYFTLKKDIDEGDDSAAVQKDITVHVDAVNGSTQIALLPADTGSLSGVYFYDIQYKDDSVPPVIKTILSGKYTWVEDVTRRTS